MTNVIALIDNGKELEVLKEDFDGGTQILKNYTKLQQHINFWK